MTFEHRLGATAIAAALALLSTPAVAQVADPAAADTTTVSEPAPAETATPVPDAAPVEPSTATATPVATPAEAAPVKKAAATTKASTVLRTATPVAPRAVASTPDVAETPQAAAVPIADAAPAETPALPVDAVPAQPTAAPAEPASDMDIPLVAGAAGAAALALLGTGVLASRRRRRRDEIIGDNTFAEPRMVATPVVKPADAESGSERSAFAWGRPSLTPVSPALAAAPAQKLPSGFDISRFGRHVQAAYRGPTADNPSLSLKKRLKRASFFDLKERQAMGRSASPTMNPSLVPA